MLEIIDIGKILGEMIRAYAEEPTSLDELEIQAEQLLHRVGRQMLQQWLEMNAEDKPCPTTRCRQCGKQANYVKKRAGFANTRFGLIRYDRATYVCPHCYTSTHPMDERLNPYKSLARLRTQIAAGKSLPVSELASTWGLGTLKSPKNKGIPKEQKPSINHHLEGMKPIFVPLVRSNNNDGTHAVQG